MIGELGVGEALVSPLDAKGTPAVTERAWILPPFSQIGPISEKQRDEVRQASSALSRHYEQLVDRESAYEKLKERALASEGAGPRSAAGAPSGAPEATRAVSEILFGSTGPRGGRRDGLLEAVAKSAFRSIGSSVGRAITRGALGSILGGSRQR